MASGRLFAAHRLVYWIIALGVTILLALIMLAPGLAALFDVAAPDAPLLNAALAVAALGGGWGVVLKRWQRPPPRV